MDNNSCSMPSEYLCWCQSTSISSKLIKAHIKLRGQHRIQKIQKSELSAEKLKPYILDRINLISKVKLELQQSSTSIIQTIVANTETQMRKFDELVRLYRKMLTDPPKKVELRHKQISSIFTVNKSLNIALINHFQQKFIAIFNTIDKLKRNIKDLKSKIFKYKCSSFNCLAIFRTEKFIATGESNGFIRVWDINNKAMQYNLENHKSSVLSIALGQRDEILLSGSLDSTVILWNLKIKKIKQKFLGHKDSVNCVLISKDSSLGFSGSNDKQVIIWNLIALKIESCLSVYLTVSSICFIKNENVLVACGEEGIVFWFKSSKSQKKEIINETKSIAFTKDEHYLITGDSQGFIRIWNMESKKIIFVDKKHSSTINRIVFSPDFNNFITCSSDKTLIIWNFINRCVLSSHYHYSIISDVCFSLTYDSLVICSQHPSISYLNLKSSLVEDKIKPKKLYGQMVSLSRDLKYMAYGFTKLSLYNLETSKKVNKTYHYTPNCCLLKFSSNSSSLCCGYLSGQISILSIPELELVKTFNYSQNQVKCLALSSNRKILACSFFNENKFFVHNIEKIELAYYKEEINVHFTEFCNNDKRLVAYAFPYSIYVVNENYEKITILNINHLCSSMIVCSNDKSIVLSYLPFMWSSIDAALLKVVHKDKTKKELKILASDDPRFYIFSTLNHIN